MWGRRCIFNGSLKPRFEFEAGFLFALWPCLRYSPSSLRMPAFLPYLALLVVVVAATCGALVLYARRRAAASTQRQQAEREIRESEERFRQLAENIHQVFWMTTADRARVIYISPAYEEIWGRSCQSLYDEPLSFRDSIVPEDREWVLRTQTEQLQTGYDIEYRIQRPDGSRRWIWSRAFPIHDERGNVFQVAGLAEDITHRRQTEEALQGQTRLLENLVTIAQAVVGYPTVDATLQNILNVAVAVTGADHGNLLVFNGAGTVMHSMLSSGQSKSALVRENRRSIVDEVLDRGLAGWVIRHHEPALIVDAARDPRWLTVPGAPYIARSVLAAPIMEGEGVLGVLTLTHSQPAYLTAEHVQLMQAAASHMTLAILNAQIFDAQGRLADQQTMLYEVLRNLGGQLDPERVLGEAVKTLSRFAGWPNVAIAIPDSQNMHWTVRAASGHIESAISLTQAMDRGVVGRTFRTGELQYVSDVMKDPDYVVGGGVMRSELAVPIRRRGRMLGVLDIESDQLNAFNQNDMLLAESLADAVALALDNARLYRAIADESGRLQAIIKSSRDGLILIGMDRRVLVFNESAQGLLSLPGQVNDWLGQPMGEVLTALRHYAPGEMRSIVAEIRRIQTGAEPPGEGEFEIPPRKVSWLNLPVMAGEAPLGRLLVFRDVTEERLLAKMRDDLTHTTVHDLRNPLGAIFSALMILQTDQSLDALQREVVDIAVASIQHLLESVNAILDISRLESAEVPLRLHLTSLVALVDEIALVEKALLAEKKLTLHSDVPATLPLANVDPDLIRRVLQNLVGNAIKFTPPGGQVRVAVALGLDGGFEPHQSGLEFHPGDPGVQLLKVSVSDTGPGLPEGLKDRLFQKFVTGRKRESGSGLGLAFCKLAVERHGGIIWVETEPGQGTTFHFTLPVA